MLCDGGAIRREHLRLNPGCPVPEPPDPDRPLEEISRQAQRIAETERIRQALAASRGNKTKAAEALRVSYKTLLTKIRDYGLGQ
ncbi:MAG: hypothetical protein M0Z75_03890 [Nitrospiraceae bacterium]|nr:hypothetical protein [Nitrospiraceae bacterium]